MSQTPVHRIGNSFCTISGAPFLTQSHFLEYGSLQVVCQHSCKPEFYVHDLTATWRILEASQHRSQGPRPSFPAEPQVISTSHRRQLSHAAISGLQIVQRQDPVPLVSPTCFNQEWCTTTSSAFCSCKGCARTCLVTGYVSIYLSDRAPASLILNPMQSVCGARLHDVGQIKNMVQMWQTTRHPPEMSIPSPSTPPTSSCMPSW
jgi:hypothetical protein